MMEGSAPSCVPNVRESTQSEDVISVEDIAWADSCLVKDPELSDGKWSSIKDALLDVISSYPDYYCTTKRDDSVSGLDVGVLPSNEKAETSTDVQTRFDVNETVLIKTAVEEDDGTDHPTILQKNDILGSSIDRVNAFLPNYSEGLVAENTAHGLDLGFPFVEMEPLTDDIFRVWDLDIPAEDDELVKQLNKALAEAGSSQPTPVTFDDSGVQKYLKGESLDDLISGIAELSLDQISS